MSLETQPSLNLIPQCLIRPAAPPGSRGSSELPCTAHLFGVLCQLPSLDGLSRRDAEALSIHSIAVCYAVHAWAKPLHPTSGPCNQSGPATRQITVYRHDFATGLTVNGDSPEETSDHVHVLEIAWALFWITFQPLFGGPVSLQSSDGYRGKPLVLCMFLTCPTIECRQLKLSL